MDRCARVLVVGFGPFPGISRNPSEVIARRVAASPRWRLLDAAPELLVLPTTYAALDDVLRPALQSPLAAVLLIGVAGRTRDVRIERRALNRTSVLHPDAARVVPTRLTLAEGPRIRTGPVALPATARILRAHKVACGRSYDAGRYLCNAAYYQVLAGSSPVLFLHIPKPPARKPRRRHGPRSRLTWEQRLATAFVAVAAGLVRHGRNGGFRCGRPAL
jgi:pyroglutamyl-peptidase